MWAALRVAIGDLGQVWVATLILDLESRSVLARDVCGNVVAVMTRALAKTGAVPQMAEAGLPAVVGRLRKPVAHGTAARAAAWCRPREC